jgi:hypothetical protein
MEPGHTPNKVFDFLHETFGSGVICCVLFHSAKNVDTSSHFRDLVLMPAAFSVGLLERRNC